MIIQILLSTIITFLFYRGFKQLKISLVSLFISQLLINLSYGLIGNIVVSVLIFLYLVWVNFYTKQKWERKAFFITLGLSILYCLLNLTHLLLELYLRRPEQEIIFKSALLLVSIFNISSVLEYRLKR